MCSLSDIIKVPELNLVDMDVGGEDPKVDKLFLANQLEFELTNFQPHGSSTKFFKSSLSATTASKATNLPAIQDSIHSADIIAVADDTGVSADVVEKDVEKETATKPNVFEIVKEAMIKILI